MTGWLKAKKNFYFTSKKKGVKCDSCRDKKKDHENFLFLWAAATSFNRESRHNHNLRKGKFNEGFPCIEVEGGCDSAKDWASLLSNDKLPVEWVDILYQSHVPLMVSLQTPVHSINNQRSSASFIIPASESFDTTQRTTWWIFLLHNRSLPLVFSC